MDAARVPSKSVSEKLIYHDLLVSAAVLVMADCTVCIKNTVNTVNNSIKQIT